MQTTPTLVRRSESASPSADPTSTSGQTLAVAATYLLSEDGRKASLLAGGNGRAIQELTIHVPGHRLHLVRVDANGVATLKLRPRYEMTLQQRVVRVDAPPTYDTPPDLEELFREAARNHQLEHTYQTERRTDKARQHDAEQQRRSELAAIFLGDATQRALAHPAPTLRQCWLAGVNGRVLFSVNTNDADVQKVVLEAHRRFQSDLRTKREENLRLRSEQLTLHETKKQWMADWIAGHGTPEQQSRQAAGVLSLDEAIEVLADLTFNLFDDRRRYQYDGADRLREYLQQRDSSNVVVSSDDLIVTSAEAKNMNAVQWQTIQEMQKLMPEASITLRTHKISWKRDRQIAVGPLFGILVTHRVGPFTLRREYAM